MTTPTRATILLSAIASIFFASSSAIAQSQATPAAACPAGYRIIDASLCYSDKTGDIVLAEMKAAARMVTEATCRPGYRIIDDSLCYSDETGDIEMAERKMDKRTQSAAASR